MNPLLQILARVSAGEDAAFAELYERYRRPLLTQLRRLMGGRLAAKAQDEDLTQSVFLAVATALTTRTLSFASAAAFDAYLIDVARSVICKHADYWAAQRRDPTREIDATESWESRVGLVGRPGSDPASQVAHRENVACIEGAIDALPEDLRVVLLRRRAGAAPAAIAAALHLSERTVRRRLLLARSRIESTAQRVQAGGTA